VFDDAPLPHTLVERLRTVRSCGVITGAGVSQESGIGTYRSSDGRYDDPLIGGSTAEALSARTLAADPDCTWEAIGELCRRALAARPSPAHRALAAIERKIDRFVLVTQNVDGLHQIAGSHNVIELHGNLFRTRCVPCDLEGRLDHATLVELHAAPRCPRCGGVVRPDVVLFGELLPLERVEPLLDEFYLHPPDLVIAAGTSAQFTYVSEPVLFAQQAGRLTIEVNPRRTLLTDQVSIALHGTASTYLPRIARALGADLDRFDDDGAPHRRADHGQRPPPRDIESG